MRALKHLLAVAVCILGSLAVFATSEKAQINILSLRVNPVMPAALTQWGFVPGGFLLTAQSAGLEGVNPKLVNRTKKPDSCEAGFSTRKQAPGISP